MSLSEAVVVLMDVTVPEFKNSLMPSIDTRIDKTKDPNTTFIGKIDMTFMIFNRCGSFVRNCCIWEAKTRQIF